MNLRHLSLESTKLRLKITFFVFPKNLDSLAEYSIEVILLSSYPPIVWNVDRSFADFEKFRSGLTTKFDSVPYLPCKVIFPLTDRERRDRVDLFEVFLRKCVEDPAIFNSQELRSFLEIDKFTKTNLNPITLLHSSPVAWGTLMGGLYFFRSQELLLLNGADSEPENPKIFSLTNFFSRQKYAKAISTPGSLRLGRESSSGQFDFDFSLKDQLFFDNNPPSSFAVSSSGLIIAVGFEDGLISGFTVEIGKLIRFVSMKVHQGAVQSIVVLEEEGCVLSIGGGQNLCLSNFQQNGKISQEISDPLDKMTAMHFSSKFSIVFVGDRSGSISLYALDLQRPNNRLSFLVAANFKNEKIESIVSDFFGSRLFLGYDDGEVLSIDTGVGFKSKMTVSGRWTLRPKIQKLFFLPKNANLVVAHGNGLLSFCDAFDPSNFFTSKLGEQEGVFAQVIEEKRMILLLARQEFKILSFPEFLFSKTTEPKSEIVKLTQPKLSEIPEKQESFDWRKTQPPNFFSQDEPESVRNKNSNSEELNSSAHRMSMKKGGKILHFENSEDEDDDLEGWNS